MSKELIIPSKFTIDDKFSSGFKNMMKSTQNELNQTTGSMSKFSSFIKNNQESFRTMGRNATIAGGVILGSFGLMANSAIKFEDKMADVAKTTGLKGKALEDFGTSLLTMSEDTRSSIDDLSTIAEIGGRLAVPKEELKAFTQEANKFSVALGGDFSGGVESAVTEFSKLKGLFKDTKDLDISEALQKSGSAFNSLSSKGVNIEGLTDFSLRVGALPEVMRPTLASASALGATLQKSGVDAQVASSGFSNFISKAGQDLPKFAKAMGVSVQEAKNLYNTDTASFFAEFASKMEGIPADQLALKLKDLGLNSLEVQKAVGAMAGSLGTYNEFQKISNQQMKLGTSIGEEYNTKNNNTAAGIEKAKNTVQSLSITMGQLLLPILADVMKSVMPMVRSFSEWVKENKPLVTGIVKFAAGLGATLAVLGPILFAIGSYNRLMKSFTIATDVSKVAMKAFGVESSASMKSLGMAVGVLALVSISLDSYAFATREAMTSTQLLNNVGSSAAMIANEQLIETRLLFDQLRKNKEGTDQYKTALQQIEQMQPGLIDKYNLQEKSLLKLKNAENELKKSIKERAFEQAKKEQLVNVNAKVLDLEQKVANTKGQSWVSEFIQGFGDYENTHSQLVESLAIAKQEKARVEASFDKEERNSAMTGNRSMSTELSEEISRFTKSEVLLKIDNNGSIQNVNLLGGSNFAMNVIPAITSTVK